MKFLVDAQLPSKLCRTLRAAGHDAIHTLDLPLGNGTSDAVICDLSVQEHRAVMTKDTDFYHSFVLTGKPWKLVLIRTGNIGVSDLCLIVSCHLDRLVELMKTNDLVEIDRHHVRVQLPTP